MRERGSEGGRERQREKEGGVTGVTGRERGRERGRRERKESCKTNKASSNVKFINSLNKATPTFPGTLTIVPEHR